MHVLALAAAAFGGYGGIAQSTQDLMHAVAALDPVERITILPREAAGDVTGLPSAAVQLPAIPGRLKYTATAARLALTRRPDIIYCGHLYMAPLAATLARLTRSRLVAHLHGLELYGNVSSGQRAALKRADMILCVSHDTSERLREVTSGAPVHAPVIYNTYAPHFCPGDRPAARTAFALEDQQKVLLTVARLDTRQRHKGHDMVLQQIPSLVAAGHDVVYLVCGVGDDLERLKAVATELGVADRVRFLGRVPFSELPDLYRAADIYVMPSTGEGFGIAFIEAMACGTPAIGLAVRGAKDALSHSSLATAVTPEAFPAALELALRAPQAAHEQGAATIAEQFGWPAFQRRVNDAFQGVLASIEHK